MLAVTSPHGAAARWAWGFGLGAPVASLIVAGVALYLARSDTRRARAEAERAEVAAYNRDRAIYLGIRLELDDEHAEWTRLTEGEWHKKGARWSAKGRIVNASGRDLRSVNVDVSSAPKWWHRVGAAGGIERVEIDHDRLALFRADDEPIPLVVTIHMQPAAFEADRELTLTPPGIFPQVFPSDQDLSVALWFMDADGRWWRRRWPMGVHPQFGNPEVVMEKDFPRYPPPLSPDEPDVKWPRKVVRAVRHRLHRS